jgi:hypothetical protein
MPSIREMQQLRAEHAALIALSRILLDMARAPHPPRPTELASVRALLRDTLVRHLKCEDWVLYPLMKASGEPETVRITCEFEFEMGDLAADFVAYDDKWTASRIEAEWPDFCRETRTILDMLAVRVEREERGLYPLADNLRAAPGSARDGSAISG